MKGRFIPPIAIPVRIAVCLAGYVSFYALL